MKNKSGNILQVKSGVILQQVNCQGIMGSGVAAGIRANYPIVFQEYSAVTGPEYSYPDSGRGLLGRVIFTKVSETLCIASIFGQQFFGRDQKRYTSYDALDLGFQEVAHWLESVGCSSSDVHTPLLGSGLGGGQWSVISTLMEHHIGPDITLWTL